MLQTIVNNGMQDIFSEHVHLFTHFLGRSFSALKRVKNYLRSTLKDEKLNHLALMHTESSVLQKVNVNNVLYQFVDRLARKMFKSQ